MCKLAWSILWDPPMYVCSQIYGFVLIGVNVVDKETKILQYLVLGLQCRCVCLIHEFDIIFQIWYDYEKYDITFKRIFFLSEECRCTPNILNDSNSNKHTNTHIHKNKYTYTQNKYTNTNTKIHIIWVMPICVQCPQSL